MPPETGRSRAAARPAVVALAAALAVAAAPGGAHEPSAQAPSPSESALLGAAFAAAREGKWETAYSLAAKEQNPLATKVVGWLALARAQPSPRFEAFAEFIGDNPDWPDLDTIGRRAEAAMGARLDDGRVFAWFAAHPPLTGPGKARLAEAYLAAGDVERATVLLREAWVEGDFAYAEERVFHNRHRKRLRREDHVARLDRLLWTGRQRSAARRLLHHVDAGHRALALARISLMTRAGGVDAAIAKVPEELRDHPGLQFERLRWRRRKGEDAFARDILAAPPDDLVRPRAWWRESNILSRRAVREGLISVAYELASNHRQTDPLTRSQAEWLAGWVALRFLADPGLAYPHFTTLHDGVRTPISVARAAYWAGRAAAAANDPPLARDWYERAARNPTTYYGQLALAVLGARGHPPLADDPAVGKEDVEFVQGHELTRVVRMLGAAGETELMRPFVLRLAELGATPGRHRLVAALAASAGGADLGVVVARRCAREGLILVEHGYPVIAFPSSRNGRTRAEPALLIAMLRQESGFGADAVSRAGARGLMQILPRTARTVARRLGLPYSKKRLTSDESYNLTLGRAYIEGLLDTYGGSYVLALAAYNGGARRVRAWLRNFGDPRTGEVDVIDWIEMIPVSETRNYVQRVLEAVPVYRRILGGPAYGLSLDLHRGGKAAPG